MTILVARSRRPCNRAFGADGLLPRFMRQIKLSESACKSNSVPGKRGDFLRSRVSQSPCDENPPHLLRSSPYCGSCRSRRPCPMPCPSPGRRWRVNREHACITPGPPRMFGHAPTSPPARSTRFFLSTCKHTNHSTPGLVIPCRRIKIANLVPC